MLLLLASSLDTYSRVVVILLNKSIRAHSQEMHMHTMDTTQ